MDATIIEIQGGPLPSEFQDVHEEARRLLGPEARLLGWSKSAYSQKYPTHQVVFNANCYCSAQGEQDGWRKVWYGDLDLDRDAQKLQALADGLHAAVAVLYELDGRFDREDAPAIDRAVAVYEPAD